jgi:hypothetical protein
MINFNLNIPSKDSLLAADALLYAVYGYEPKKVKDMKLTEIERLVKKAEKEMTWFEAYKFKSLLESKPKTLWQKILSKIKI